MELQVIDVAIIIILIFGALLGYKRGILKSSVSFFGAVLVVILAFMFKNPVSELMYTHLPFFNLGEYFAGISLINILIYEAIAFALLIIVFGIILRLIIVFTGLVEKILSLTVVLGFVSKILGLVFGFIETLIIVFIGLFVLHNFINFTEAIDSGSISSKILNNTPILTSLVEDENKTLSEINSLQTKCKNASGDEAVKCNQESLDIMLKYDVLKPDTALKLVNDNKIKITDAKEIIAKYQKDAN